MGLALLLRLLLWIWAEARHETDYGPRSLRPSEIAARRWWR
jgi:hypothetical protein